MHACEAECARRLLELVGVTTPMIWQLVCGPSPLVVLVRLLHLTASFHGTIVVWSYASLWHALTVSPRIKSSAFGVTRFPAVAR